MEPRLLITDQKIKELKFYYGLTRHPVCRARPIRLQLRQDNGLRLLRPGHRPPPPAPPEPLPLRHRPGAAAGADPRQPRPAPRQPGRLPGHDRLCRRRCGGAGRLLPWPAQPGPVAQSRPRLPRRDGAGGRLPGPAGAGHRLVHPGELVNRLSGRAGAEMPQPAETLLDRKQDNSRR
uniref:Uncharacterized protein n=1 Tax=Macrostomum lignano TaxID=282301 RepID=A0A1I8JHB4_9PLAT